MGASAEVERAGGAVARAFHDVEVDHGGFEAGVAEEILDSPDGGAGLQQVGGEAVVQGMGRDSPGDGGPAHGPTKLACHGIFVDMIA